MTTGNLSGIARPGAKLMAALGRTGDTRPVTELLDELMAVDSFAALLTEGIESVTAKDGRLDTKDLAAFVLRRMKESQR